MAECLIGTVTTDRQLNILTIDDRLRRLLSAEEGDNLGDYVEYRQMEYFVQVCGDITPGDHTMVCASLILPEGGSLWTVAVVYGGETESEQICRIFFQDIQSMEQRAIDASLDPGTGILNKKAITDYARQRMEEHPDALTYLCIVDIDNFKQMNDNHGHQFGDKVLLKTVNVICNAVGDKGAVGRIGGDEFLIISDKIHDKEELRSVLRDIRTGVEESFKQQLPDDYPTVSIGCVQFPLQVSTYEDAFYVADRMLYRAKEKGRNRYIIYVPEIHGDVLHCQEIPDITNRSSVKIDRTSLMFRLLDDFLCSGTMTFQTALVNIAACYGLDGIYMYNDRLDVSMHGFTGKQNPKTGVMEGSDAVMEFPIAECNEIVMRRNDHGVSVIDDVAALKDSDPDAFVFMHEHGIHNIIVYKMQDNEKGYVVFLKTDSLARKFSASDVADLTLIGKIIDVTFKRR